MSARTGTLAWVGPILAADALDATDTLLLLALADHVNEDDECYVGIANLAKYARCSYGTARRRLGAMEASGVITRTTRWRDDGGRSVYHYRLNRPAVVAARKPADPPSKVRGGVRAPGRAGGTAHPGARAEPPRKNHPERTTPASGDAEQPENLWGDTESTATPATVNPAQVIAKQVWENRTPRPVIKFVALVKMVERFLEAGWRPDQIATAMAVTRAFTDQSVMYSLTAASPSGPSPRQQRKAAAASEFVGDEQPTGAVGRRFYRVPTDQNAVGQ